MRSSLNQQRNPTVAVGLPSPQSFQYNLRNITNCESMSSTGRNHQPPRSNGTQEEPSSGDSTDSPPRLPPQLRVTVGAIPHNLKQTLEAQYSKDHQFIREFGAVRPPQAFESQGQKLVVAGTGVVSQPAEEAKYFMDILWRFVPGAFGRAWYQAQSNKVENSKHPMLMWRKKASEYMGRCEKTANGIYIPRMTAPMAAYFGFAYDLWVVHDTGRLDKRFLERLKNRDQFQGARHELFAEATCIRGNFEIMRENEADGQTRHAEFTATHRLTKQTVSVEAKSKHRRGILGYPGEREEAGDFYMPIGKLLSDAVEKRPPHPLVLFLELNLPYDTARPLFNVSEAMPYSLVHKAMDDLRKRNGGRDLIAHLVMTNNAENHCRDDQIAPSGQVLSMYSNVSSTPVPLLKTFSAIHEAVLKYGNIPEFE